MKKFIEFVSEELESDDEEAERKAKLKAALAATAQVGKGGMQKKGYTGSTYNPQTKVQKEALESDDELNSRPGAWRSKADLNNRTKKDGSPTKHERGMQDNLKARIKMQNKSGGLTGPKGTLPEETELDEENLHRVIGQVYSDDDQKWYHQSYTTRAKSREHAVQKAKEQFGTRGQKFRNVEHDAEIHEEFELDEVAKPKGVVDKNVGKPPKESKSGFKTGQRVAHYRGMGKTLHGNVTNPDASSGGKKGAMVKFEHGTEFVPHKDLKDASQYWKDEDESMRKERDKPKSVAKEETALKTFSQFTKGAN